jgi:hypothetical protein
MFLPLCSACTQTVSRPLPDPHSPNHGVAAGCGPKEAPVASSVRANGIGSVHAKWFVSLFIEC